MPVRALIGPLFCGALACASACAAAQAYPAKPVRVVVPTSPGGVNDVVTRLLAPRFGEALGRPVFVENHPPTVRGTAMVAKAPADGYTLLSVFDNFPLIQLLYRDVPYDARRDFSAVALVVRNPMIVVVPAQLGVRDLGEFLRLARSPGKLNYATAGAGTSSHLTAELFKRATGIAAQAVHYKGAAPAVGDLLGARVQLMIAAAGTLASHVASGKLVPLAVTSTERLALLPNVPAMAETVPGFEARGWQGMVAPAGTADEILARLNADVARALRAPEVRRSLEDQAYEVVGSPASVLAALIVSEHDKWAKVIREQNITLD